MTYRTDKLEYDPLTHGIYCKKTHAIYDKHDQIPFRKQAYLKLIEMFKQLVPLCKKFETMSDMITGINALTNQYNKHEEEITS